MAHAQIPDLVFQRNGRVHLNRRGIQFSRLLAVEECGSAGRPWIDLVPRYSARVVATLSNRLFPLHFPSHASPCTIRFRTASIALLFHDRGTTRGRVVSSTTRPYFNHGKDPVPIVQEAGWAPGPICTGGKSRPTGIRSPGRPAPRSVAILTELPGQYFKILRLFYSKATCLT